ncbi:MAG: fused MFS/spermidine synthase [Candidatus Eremiobacteraeota bacterium]|nr:fused MFS/spermidine synthase [Candidatus Eremiobacteraeota bacterium]MCW5870433.1 fused MFS/spermidine synthase [Candidatus Eremiobacteraeota bacterium]
MRKSLLGWFAIFFLWIGAGVAWAQREKVLALRHSPFNDLKVVQEGYERVLKVRQGKVYVEESRCDVRRPAHLLHQYSRLQLLGSLYPRNLGRGLVVGLGGGSLSKALLAQFPELQVDSIELDPEIVKLAHEFFGYHESERCHSIVSDAREYLEKNDSTYDLIVLDAFDGLEIPSPLRTVQFYGLVKKHLNPGGVVVSNLHCRSGNYDRDRVSLARQFKHIVAYQGTGLAVVVAAPQELRADRSRWSSNWGFPLEPLLHLEEKTAHFDSTVRPFED